MKLRTIGLISTLVLGLFAGPLSTEAQQRGKVYRIGYLASGSGTRVETLREFLHELGYVDGKNITILWRAAQREYEQLPRLAEDLVRLKVDVLFASSRTVAVAFKNATRTIPIVFISATDPVTAGLVDSLARPGGNLTGLTQISPELAGKRLELLKETIPKLTRVAVLWQPGNPGSEDIWKQSQLRARELGLQLHSMEVSSADKFEGAFQEATKARSAGLAVTQSSLINANRNQIADLAIKNRLPAIYTDSRFASSGGLMSYGVDRSELFRRAATYVVRILKGRKAGRPAGRATHEVRPDHQLEDGEADRRDDSPRIPPASG